MGYRKDLHTNLGGVAPLMPSDLRDDREALVVFLGEGPNGGCWMSLTDNFTWGMKKH